MRFPPLKFWHPHDHFGSGFRKPDSTGCSLSAAIPCDNRIQKETADAFQSACFLAAEKFRNLHWGRSR